jgi:hypothetical protein
MEEVRLWLGSLLTATGCFGLSLGDEPFVCGGTAGDLCPPGYDCVFGVCTVKDRPDAAVPDAMGMPASCTPNDFQECQDGTHALVCNNQGTAILLMGGTGGDARDEAPGTGGTGSVGGGKGGIGEGNGEGPEPGKPSGGPGAGGGGGGGAAGRIRLNARPDKPITIAPGARVVPAASQGPIDRAPTP